LHREKIIGLQGVNFKRRSGVNSIFRSTIIGVQVRFGRRVVSLLRTPLGFK
jgi:hypothetical protein